MANVKTVSFGAGNADLQAQQMEIQRRQQMADMLRQQAATPIQQQEVSGRVVAVSPWEGVAKLGQAYLANKAQEKNDAKQGELSATLAKRQAAALRSLAPAGVFPTEGPQEGQPQVDPDTRARWVQALAAYEQNPELGGKLIQELSKQPEFSTTPQYDQQGNAFVLNNQGQQKMLEGVKARDKLENVNGVWQNPYAQENNSFAPQDPNKPFGMGPNGVVPNQAFQQYELGKAKAGAPNITTKIENKAAESIAGQVGPILKDSYVAAQGANAQIDAASRVIQAVDSNKMFAGPLASKRMSLAQFGQALGVGGADSAEQIANTRQAMRGLAELTLQGRKSMRGEGAITESEGKLAERAMSGDIDSMTPAELRIIAKASERTARHNLGEHNRKIGMAKSNPATSGIAGYFESAPIEQEQQQAAPKVRRYNPATGRIE